MNENEIGSVVVQCAIALHRELGPGLLESVYEITLAHEFKQRNLNVLRQVPIPIRYKGIQFDEGFRADIIVENKVLLELKSVETTAKVHRKQVLTYLKLTGLKLGHLLNFGENLIKEGIFRLINGTLK